MPRILTFNELNGEEVAQVIKDQIALMVANIPYLQRHLTLPRVRIATQIKLEIWADLASPQELIINDKYEVVENSPAAFQSLRAEMVEAEMSESSAPIPGGYPPDRIRAIHGMPLSRPGPGEREGGGHLYTADRPELEQETESRHPGLKITRSVASGTTVINPGDPGPAGLAQGVNRRTDINLRQGTPAPRQP
jgi:hypothetical protein